MWWPVPSRQAAITSALRASPPEMQWRGGRERGPRGGGGVCPRGGGARPVEVVRRGGEPVPPGDYVADRVRRVRVEHHLRVARGARREVDHHRVGAGVVRGGGTNRPA